MTLKIVSSLSMRDYYAAMIVTDAFKVIDYDHNDVYSSHHSGYSRKLGF